MDVKSVYLNGDLQETIYMRQPEGFVRKGKESLVLRLRKSLYSLKQAGRTWNAKMDATLKSHGFTAPDADQCIYIRRQHLILISLYVDDLLIACNRLFELKLYKQQLIASVTWRIWERSVSSLASVAFLTDVIERQLRRFMVHG